MYSVKILRFISFFLGISGAVQQSIGAVSLAQDIQKKFISAGGAPKALAHLNCIIKNFQARNIAVEKLDPSDPFTERCNKVPEVRLNNLNTVVLVDYTLPSTQRRMWLIPTDQNSNKKIARLFVSHGRFDTTHDNLVLGPNKNTVQVAKFFSNVRNSNASATGFYITGEIYYGDNVGPNPKDPKHSLYLHGVEDGINDNSCARATVIHGSANVNEAGKNVGVKRMSSGCFMVDYNFIEKLHDLIKSPDERGGTALLSYSDREASLSDDYYCRL